MSVLLQEVRVCMGRGMCRSKLGVRGGARVRSDTVGRQIGLGAHSRSRTTRHTPLSAPRTRVCCPHCATGCTTHAGRRRLVRVCAAHCQPAHGRAGRDVWGDGGGPGRGAGECCFRSHGGCWDEAWRRCCVPVCVCVCVCMCSCVCACVCGETGWAWLCVVLATERLIVTNRFRCAHPTGWQLPRPRAELHVPRADRCACDARACAACHVRCCRRRAPVSLPSCSLWNSTHMRRCTQALARLPPPPPHTPSPHTHTHTTTHTHTHTGAYEVHSLPSKRVGLYAPHGGTLIARSDTNGEDLEAFAGAGLYDRCVRVSCAQSCAVLGNCVRGGVTRRGDACPSAAASLCLPPPKLTPRLTPATHAHTHTHTHTHTLTH
jgi:hypothetical protein